MEMPKKSKWNAKIQIIFTAAEARFLSNAQTQKRPPDSRHRRRQTPTHPTIASFVFLATRVATVRIYFHFFSASHERRTHTAKRDGHWLLY
jgi:hypothetical protein